MISAILFAGAAAWWASSMAVLVLSSMAALAFPVRSRGRQKFEPLPPITAIVPVKSVHAGFDEAQRSLFEQDYPALEILFAASEGDGPAVEAARRVCSEFPRTRWRIVLSDCTAAASPKLNNIWPAIHQASSDLILTKDSNLLLAPGELESLVRQLGPEVGLVSTIPIAKDPGSFAGWIEASIINCYHARVLMLADAAGLGFGLGKIMLFRRSDLMRAGGLARIGWALGEDMALARTMENLGLRVGLGDHVSEQFLGERRFSAVWQRQLRWMVIWRVQLPAAFIGELLGSALPTAIAGAYAAFVLGFQPFPVFAATLGVWFVLESVVCVGKGWPLSVWSLLAFAGREILTPILWLRACTTNRVVWAGNICVADSERARERTHPAGKMAAKMGKCD